MDVETHRDLRLLEAVHQDGRVTQRGLASKLGIALGLANVYLKRMVHKGFIKVVNVQPNRITYLVTPRGIAEKARLTYEFMDYSLHLYGEVRQHLRTALQACAEAGKRVAICGSGEAAELAYLSLKEAGLEPVAVFDHEGQREFLGMPVLPIGDHATVEFDLIGPPVPGTARRRGRPRETVPAAAAAGATSCEAQTRLRPPPLHQRQALASNGAYQPSGKYQVPSSVNVLRPFHRNDPMRNRSTIPLGDRQWL
jgi:DNA-binding MarR family transcriptional regulator